MHSLSPSIELAKVQKKLQSLASKVRRLCGRVRRAPLKQAAPSPAPASVEYDLTDPKLRSITLEEALPLLPAALMHTAWVCIDADALAVAAELRVALQRRSAPANSTFKLEIHSIAPAIEGKAVVKAGTVANAGNLEAQLKAAIKRRQERLGQPETVLEAPAAPMVSIHPVGGANQVAVVSKLNPAIAGSAQSLQEQLQAAIHRRQERLGMATDKPFADALPLLVATQHDAVVSVIPKTTRRSSVVQPADAPSATKLTAAAAPQLNWLEELKQKQSKRRQLAA